MSPAEFRLYQTSKKEEVVFKPIVEGKVGMYVCGVTPYDFSHIGHARAYVAFDILYRYLRYSGYEVVYVRNFTDIDDKIINRANKSGEDPIELSARFSQEFLKDMADLQCLPPTHQPKVTDHIEQIKDMIAKIIENGHAYAVDGNVYFSVDSFQNYGVMLVPERRMGDNRPGARVGDDQRRRKKNDADFALWKAAAPGEPQWDSPWGPGRPGWHIECSAMSSLYLTHAFDIHGGGMDLMFPHHENELAQSKAACKDSKINYWVHNGFVNTGNGEKMSKSLRNFTSIRDVTEKYHPLALRYFFLGTKYRSPITYSISELDIASVALFYTYQTLQHCEDAMSSFQTVEKTGKSKERADLEANLANDLDTPEVLKTTLQGALKSVNGSIKKLKKEPDEKEQLNIKESLADLHTDIRNILDVLGLLSNLSYTEVLQQLKDKFLTRAGLTEDGIQDYIKERRLARQNRDFSKSDAIRHELAAKGISLMDDGGETVWQPSRPTS